MRRRAINPDEVDAATVTSAPPAGLADPGELLVFTLGDGRTVSAWLPPRATLTVGRGAEVSLSLSDPSLSRRHARITWHRDGLHVVDLGAKNGLLVAGCRTPDAVLSPGQLIYLGDVALAVHQPRARRLPTAVGSASVGADPGGAVFASQLMTRLFDEAAVNAASRLPALIIGETGTGKELVARRLHSMGPRAAEPMISLNCGALPSSLVESVLFGHERGAFTGADQTRKGAFEEADRGTLFLDEIGELSAAAQAVLLRVLETGIVTRIGAQRPITVDVRIVAATHRDLEAMVAAGTFRADLRFRLDVLPLKVPPLRERLEDIPVLALHFATQAGGGALGAEVLERLGRYAWPGNVRELRHVIERAALMAGGRSIETSHLGERVVAATAVAPSPLDRPASPPDPSAVAATGPMDHRAQMRAAERRLILEALAAAGGNQTAAARAIGMPLRTLVYKMRQHEIRKGYGP